MSDAGDPMSAEETILRFRRIARGEATTADVEWFALAIAQYLESGRTLDEIFGLAVKLGGKTWRWREGLSLRNDALRRLAHRLHPTGTLAEQAYMVRQKVERYEGTNWPRDCERENVPPTYLGQSNEFLFMAFRAAADARIVPAVPKTAQHLRAILAGGDRDENQVGDLIFAEAAQPPSIAESMDHDHEDNRHPEGHSPGAVSDRAAGAGGGSRGRT